MNLPLGWWPDTPAVRDAVKSIVLAEWENDLTGDEAFRVASFGIEREMPEELRRFILKIEADAELL